MSHDAFLSVSVCLSVSSQEEVTESLKLANIDKVSIPPPSSLSPRALSLPPFIPTSLPLREDESRVFTYRMNTRLLQCVAVCCSVLQCAVAVCCSVLQCEDKSRVYILYVLCEM